MTNGIKQLLTIQGKIGDLDLVYSGAYMNRVIHAESDYTTYTFWYDKLSDYYVTNNAGKPVEGAQDIFEGDQFTKLSNEEFACRPTLRTAFIGLWGRFRNSSRITYCRIIRSQIWDRISGFPAGRTHFG